MNNKEKLKELEKAIKNAQGDRIIAKNNHNYEYASNLKKYINELIAEKKALKEELSKD